MLTKTPTPQFAIEKDVPFVIHEAAPGSSKYPLARMEVGDSFFVPDQTSNGSAAGYVRMLGRHKGRKYSARAVDGGVRIWRTA